MSYILEYLRYNFLICLVITPTTINCTSFFEFKVKSIKLSSSINNCYYSLHSSIYMRYMSGIISKKQANWALDKDNTLFNPAKQRKTLDLRNLKQKRSKESLLLTTNLFARWQLSCDMFQEPAFAALHGPHSLFRIGD